MLIAFVFVLFACNSKGNKSKTEEKTDVKKEVVAAKPNTLTDEEKADGWKLLFDGKTSEGWTSIGVNKTFPKGWKINQNGDGTLFCPGSGKGEAGGEARGDVMYAVKKFGNFHLKLEWKISEGGNSGIFYLARIDDRWNQLYQTAPEMQVLDNERHPDASAGKDGNRQAGALYDLIPAVPQNAKPAGEWNSVEIKVYKGSVWHIMNGETVVEYHLWTPEWNELVAGSKFPAINPDWHNVASEGYFGVQDHGDDVWYRNIKIKEL